MKEQERDTWEIQLKGENSRGKNLNLKNGKKVQKMIFFLFEHSATV